MLTRSKRQSGFCRCRRGLRVDSAKLRAIAGLPRNTGDCRRPLLGAIEEVSARQIRDQFETNVFGLLNVTRAVIFRKQIEARIPLGRIGQPEDIAPAAVFLASSDAAWITGEMLHITAGSR